MITAKLSDPTPEIATGYVIVEIDDFNGILDATINIDFNWLVAWVEHELNDIRYGDMVTACTELHEDGSGSYVRYDLLLDMIELYEPHLIMSLVRYATLSVRYVTNKPK